MKNLFKSIGLILTSIVGLILLSNSAFSQRNDFFYAKYDGQGKVYFQWYFDNSKNIAQTFVIYKAEGAYKEFDDKVFKIFKKLDINQVQQDKNQVFNYQAEDKLTEPEYSYALHIYLKDGNVVKSLPFIVFNNFGPPKVGIMFISEPVRTAVMNKDYRYKVEAKSYPEEGIPIMFKLVKFPEGMKIDNLTGEISWVPKNNIKNAYVSVAAYYKDNPKIIAYHDFDIYVFTCETPITVKGKITDKNDLLVDFGYVVLIPTNYIGTPKPNENMQFGSEVINGEYTIKADAGVYFMAFYDNMGKMHIYKNTFRWDYATKLQLNCGEDKTIDWKIETLSNKYYSAKGKVTDENDKPVPYFPVVFETVSKNEVEIPENLFTIVAMTDEYGKYDIKLPEGYDFIAYIKLDKPIGIKNIPSILYYNQTFIREKATIIKSDKDNIGIDFKFMKNPDFIFRRVSGVVLDKDNRPIPGALVAFDGFNDKTNENKYYYYYDQVITDKNGKYVIELPDMFKYIAYAININEVDKNRDSRALYYKQTYNREKATVLILKDDLFGIDFKFDATNVTPIYQSAITGKVVNSENIPIQFAFVEAIRLDNDEIDYKEKSHFAYTDANGFFAFKGLRDGKYIIFASTQKSTEFSCGYYVANSVATIDIDQATRIALDGKNIVENILIQLPKFEIKQGGGIIRGEIYNERNYDEMNKANSAIAAAKLYLKENQNAIVNFNESNANGSFVITGVPSGKYTFTIEKPGFQKYEQIVEVDETNITDLGIIKLIPLGTTNVSNFEYSFAQAYPNPANNEITINFPNPVEPHSLFIINNEGKIVNTTNLNPSVIDNTIKLNVSTLTNGKYYLIINNNNSIQYIPIIINR